MNAQPDWQENPHLLPRLGAAELTTILEDHLKAIIKPQYVDHIPKAVKGSVGRILEAKASAA